LDSGATAQCELF